MGKLCNLEEFHLTSNNYEGNVSMVFEILSSKILDEMRGFKNLQSLSLSVNKFSGPMPMSIFGNGALPEFPASLSKSAPPQFSMNNPSASAPNSRPVCQLCSKVGHIASRCYQRFNLDFPESLYISSNKLSGSLPTSFGSLSNLEYLFIDSNNFKGDDVSEVHFANLTKLKFIYASRNKLSMKVGSKWVPPFSLENIELRNWNLGPHYPIWLKSRKDISQIDISNTGILGVILQWFWNNFFSNRFITVDISENQIYGPVPRIPISDMLDLSNNYLSDIEPERTTGFLRNLESLHLRNNNLVGEIPDSLKNCLALSGLDLGLNKLVGTIPRWIGSLPSLGLLVLRSNNLTGTNYQVKSQKNLQVFKDYNR
ncbi:hypothetical protein F8388_024561 [Cannabis sativa]|uniref:Uncharacterized protein n=1 Tax=Cannabis sativa TaxID=3483 RepID=A0A7J6GBT0_CANSA|nr:hypothetical protein F8388_024561 [Cannabis sativa]